MRAVKWVRKKKSQRGREVLKCWCELSDITAHIHTQIILHHTCAVRGWGWLWVSVLLTRQLLIRSENAAWTNYRKQALAEGLWVWGRWHLILQLLMHGTWLRANHSVKQRSCSTSWSDLMEWKTESVSQVRVTVSVLFHTLTLSTFKL